ncbi:hypothetical protein BC835DRAFT_1403872 [Cytidiella melzeri]|nr:hypothetical protein BC835DRAFT_1403872 [Cytidiella melzeri]
MATADRQELLRNAVVFLRDPKTVSSPLAQRVQFLEAKGLTGAEIEEAMRQAASASLVSASPYGPAAYQPAYGPAPYVAQPPLPWDWRDYFLRYSEYVLVLITHFHLKLILNITCQKYVMPHLQPPSATAYEEDRDSLTAQFDAAEALLKEIQAETSAVRAAVEEQREKIDKTTSDVDAAVKEMREGESKTREELASIREEVNTVRDMLPKMIDKSKESHTQSLLELQQELKSLKTLLLSRGGSVTPSGVSTPVLPGKPSIPAWQLSGTNFAVSSSTSSLPGTPTASSISSPPYPSPYGKGKEVDSSVNMFSQWRHAVENLTQHSPKPSQDALVDDAAALGLAESLTGSAASSSSQLAEAAMSNLRKSLGPQRSASPSTKESNSDPTSVAPAPRSRTTLEDRLRAKLFVLGEASAGSTPNQSVKGSPSMTPVQLLPEPTTNPATDPLSPKSTPLPDSPILEASVSLPAPLSAITAHPLSPAIEDDSATTDTALEEEPSESTEAEAVEGGIAENDAAVNQSVEQPAIGRADYAAQAPAHTDISSEGQDDTHAKDTNIAPEVASTEPQVIQKIQDADFAQPSSPAVTDIVDKQDNSVSPEHSSLMDADAAPAASSEDPLPAMLINGHTDGVPTKPEELDIEALQKRLKLVEQRFTDVSTSFKRLQAEKVAADRVLQDMTSVQTIQEVDALRDFLQNMNFKAEMTQDEIKRLTGKLTRQEERIEELRDIHHLESKSQSDLIEKLRGQLHETEALLKAGQSSSQYAEEEASKHRAEVEKLRTEMEKMKSSAKDEEEKRVKAVSLLKTVRQKLVKAEKEREDALKELQSAKTREKEEREKDKVEKQKLHEEIDKGNLERETAIKGLKMQFDKEVAGLKDRQDKELTALRGQYELEVITLKSLHSKEIDNKSSQISDLSASLQIVSREKDEIFDQLQMRQAELESSQSHLESLQSQSTELQHQLREATDRIALLSEEIADAQKMQFAKVHSSTPSAEVTQLLSSAEAKYEARIADLRRQLTAVERERDETEAELSKKISEKVKEVEHLKSTVGKSVRAREEEEETVASLRREIESLRDAGTTYERLIADLQGEAGRVAEVEFTAQAHIAEVKGALAVVEKQLEEAKARESQTRAINKTLREEMRKVQSSAALLERQRNPGVGYWASKGESTTDLRSPTSSTSDLPRETTRPGSPSTKSDEEVNYEYLRNVILQFLEHKEMRPHLVRVLSTILRFTPQETRRLVAKV